MSQSHSGSTTLIPRKLGCFGSFHFVCCRRKDKIHPFIQPLLNLEAKPQKKQKKNRNNEQNHRANKQNEDIKMVTDEKQYDRRQI